jgi:bacterioferritin (cytochrome b1)
MCIKEKMKQDLQYYTELAEALRDKAHRAYMADDYDAYDALFDILAAVEDVRDALATALGV